jgi:hypothetical protein
MRSIVVVCDYCGKRKEFGRQHEPGGEVSPKMVTIEVWAAFNDKSDRFLCTTPPRDVAMRNGVGQSTTNGSVRLELCLDCAAKALFGSVDIKDGKSS